MNITDDGEGKNVPKVDAVIIIMTIIDDDSCVFNINFNIDNIKKNLNFKYVYNDITLPKLKVSSVPLHVLRSTKIVYIYRIKKT